MASEKKNDTLATALRHVRHSQQNMKTLGSRHNVRQVVFDESAKGKTETKSGGNAEKHVSYADLVQLIKKLDQRLFTKADQRSRHHLIVVNVSSADRCDISNGTVPVVPVVEAHPRDINVSSVTALAT